LKIAYIVPV